MKPQHYSTVYVYSSFSKNHRWCVMVGVVASNVVDRGFVPLSSQTKYYKIDVCCFSNNHAALRSKSNDYLFQYIICTLFPHVLLNRIGGVSGSVLDSNVVDGWFGTLRL